MRFWGGTNIFKEAKIRRFWAANPESKWRPLLLKKLYPYMKLLNRQSTAYLKTFFHIRPDDLISPFFSHLPRWEMTAMLRVFLSDAVREELSQYDAVADLEAMLPASFYEWDDLTRAQFLELTLLLPGYILSSQGDRVAMAHAVEGRFPFLDHRLVEFAFTLPPRLKMRALNEKHILKRIAAKRIPPAIVKRPKQPYRAPDAASFFVSGGAAAPWVDRLLSASALRDYGVFNEDTVGHLAQKAKAGRIVGVKDNMAMVGILSTQLLMEQFIYGNIGA